MRMRIWSTIFGKLRVLVYFVGRQDDRLMCAVQTRFFLVITLVHSTALKTLKHQIEELSSNEKTQNNKKLR